MKQTHGFQIDKLIRDKIPQIIRESGIDVFERVLEKDEYLKRLKDKLLEEAAEVLSAGSKKEICEELADVLEVMIALLKIYGLEFEHIIQKAKQKRAERGGFDNRTYIDSIKIEASHPNLAYYRSRPDKYPEENKIQFKNIEFTSTPSIKDIDFLTHKINQETPEFGEAHPFAFFIRDERNQIIAGCNGSVIFGSIYTDQLWVHHDYRKNGFGKKLMEEVHDYGRKLGCLIATISTMSFQGAKTFYEKLGYVSDFERPGYTKNSTCLFMRKEL